MIIKMIIYIYLIILYVIYDMVLFVIENGLAICWCCFWAFENSFSKFPSGANGTEPFGLLHDWG